MVTPKSHISKTRKWNSPIFPGNRGDQQILRDTSNEKCEKLLICKTQRDIYQDKKYFRHKKYLHI